MNLAAALRWLESTVMTMLGHSLREPEMVILRGTWRGLTYEQMAQESQYSTNYLMRDVAPKLWKQLSVIFGRSLGKNNFRVALVAYVAANARNDPTLAVYGLTDGLADSPRAAVDPPVEAENLGRFSRPRSAEVADFSGYGFEEDRGFWSGGSEPIAEEMEACLDWHPAVISENSQAANSNRANLPTTNRLLADAVSSAVVFGNLPWAIASQLMMGRSPKVMYGYEDELHQGAAWLGASPLDADQKLDQPSISLGALPEVSAEGSADLESDRAHQLVGIWGLHGVGKTLLAEQLAAQVSDRFDAVIWRSLQDQPSLNDLCASVLTRLGLLPAADQAAAQLLAVMAQKSLLLVLEGVEALLQPGVLAGNYLPGYQVYGEFFQAVVGLRSCIVVTGIEGPTDWVRQGQENGGGGSCGGVRSLTLTGLDQQAANELLVAESLLVSDHWPDLIRRYQGHPLALKLAARMIREMFNGRVEAFLQQMPLLLDDVLRLLAPSVERLSETETNILYWLASQEAPISLGDLQRTLPLSLSSVKLISALDSLKQRSMLTIDIQQDPPLFSLPALFKSYALHQLMGQFGSTQPCGPRQQQLGVIDLRPSGVRPVRLSHWFQGQFEPDWQSLDQLFESATRPAMRLRSAYHLRDETLVKRYKSIKLDVPINGSLNSLQFVDSASGKQASAPEAVLLVAIQPEKDDLYRVCVQAQPASTESVLPAALTLNLLGDQQTMLATVTAQQTDGFIQLPYFRGAIAESFAIDLVLSDVHHTETFVI